MSGTSECPRPRSIGRGEPRQLVHANEREVSPLEMPQRGRLLIRTLDDVDQIQGFP